MSLSWHERLFNINIPSVSSLFLASSWSAFAFCHFASATLHPPLPLSLPTSATIHPSPWQYNPGGEGAHAPCVPMLDPPMDGIRTRTDIILQFNYQSYLPTVPDFVGLSCILAPYPVCILQILPAFFAIIGIIAVKTGVCSAHLIRCVGLVSIRTPNLVCLTHQ